MASSTALLATAAVSSLTSSDAVVGGTAAGSAVSFSSTLPATRSSPRLPSNEEAPSSPFFSAAKTSSTTMPMASSFAPTTSSDSRYEAIHVLIALSVEGVATATNSSCTTFSSVTASTEQPSLPSGRSSFVPSSKSSLESLSSSSSSSFVVLAAV